MLTRIEQLLRQIDQPQTPAERLEALKALDALSPEDRASLPPRLVHFLQRRSYDKARAFLAGETDQPEGNCGQGWQASRNR
ncbi:MAG: hypothetical protein ACFB20_06400 [Opitutales bacterium]